MELRHLRYFLVAAQLQNFTAAANRLNITQPTLSHQIKQLEDTLGVALFERLGRTIRLTAAGQTFQVHAKRVLQEVDLGCDALHSLQGLKQGRLTIGVLSSFGTFSLPPILAKFSVAHPGIKINVVRLGSREIEKRLLDGELDLAVANTPASASQIVVEPLVADSLALLVGDDHVLVGHDSVTLAELSEHGLILLPTSYSTRQIIDGMFATNNVTPSIIMEMNAIEPILSTVRHSALGTILSAALAEHWPGLHVVRVVPTVARTVAFFKRRDSHLSAAASALSDAIRLHFKGRACN